MSVGKFGLCCCGSSRASVRAEVWHFGFRPPESWMVGTWTYDGSAGTGTGPGSPPNAAAILNAMNVIRGRLEDYQSYPYRNMGWSVASLGDFQTVYPTLTIEETGTYTANGVLSDDAWCDRSWTLDYRGAVRTRLYVNGGRNGTTESDYEENLGADGTLTVTGTTVQTDVNVGNYWAFDTTGAVTEIVVTATSVTISQTTTNPPGHPNSVYTYDATHTWSGTAWTATDTMDAALALLDEVDLATITAEEAKLVQWVWADGTARAISVTADPLYGPEGTWPWAYRYWAVETDGHFCMAEACKVRVPVTSAEFGVSDPDLKRSEGRIFSANSLAPWNGSYPNKVTPGWTGTFELIEGWAAIGDTVTMLPTLVGEDLPGPYLGYDYGKAELVTAT